MYDLEQWQALAVDVSQAMDAAGSSGECAPGRGSTSRCTSVVLQKMPHLHTEDERTGSAARAKPLPRPSSNRHPSPFPPASPGVLGVVEKEGCDISKCMVFVNMILELWYWTFDDKKYEYSKNDSSDTSSRVSTQHNM